MANLKIDFTSQYPATYYALVHDQVNKFINVSSGNLEIPLGSIDVFVKNLVKKELNTYIAEYPADSLPSGVYTFRVYRRNGQLVNIEKDDLISIGQAGWNSFTQTQTNPSDIIGALESYDKRYESIHRIDMYLDSIQLGLSNNESGFARLDYDENTKGLKIKVNWRVNQGITINRIAIRGPAALGQKTDIAFSVPVSTQNNFIYVGNIGDTISNIIKSKNFYVTLDTSSQTQGRIGGYPIYTPSSLSGTGGSVSLRIGTSPASTGVSFRTR
jgi:hypothetical protein